MATRKHTFADWNVAPPHPGDALADVLVRRAGGIELRGYDSTKWDEFLLGDRWFVDESWVPLKSTAQAPGPYGPVTDGSVLVLVGEVEDPETDRVSRVVHPPGLVIETARENQLWFRTWTLLDQELEPLRLVDIDAEVPWLAEAFRGHRGNLTPRELDELLLLWG